MGFQTETQIRKVRKPGRCRWCFEWIERGPPAVRCAGVFDNELFSVRYHPECHQAVSRYCARNKCWGEELPDGPMSRGGIEYRGDLEPNKSPTYKS